MSGQQCTEPWWTEPSRRSGVRFVCLSEADLESLRRKLGAQVEAHLAYKGLDYESMPYVPGPLSLASTYHLPAMARDAAALAWSAGR